MQSVPSCWAEKAKLSCKITSCHLCYGTAHRVISQGCYLQGVALWRQNGPPLSFIVSVQN